MTLFVQCNLGYELRNRKLHQIRFVFIYLFIYNKKELGSTVPGYHFCPVYTLEIYEVISLAAFVYMRRMNGIIGSLIIPIVADRCFHTARSVAGRAAVDTPSKLSESQRNESSIKQTIFSNEG